LAGLSDSEAIDAIDAAQWDRLAINNNNREEVAVDLRVAWALMRDHEVLGTAVYDTRTPPGHSASPAQS